MMRLGLEIEEVQRAPEIGFPLPVWKARKWNQWQWLQFWTILTSLFHACQGCAVLAMGRDNKVETEIELQLWPARGSNSTMMRFTTIKKSTGTFSMGTAIAAFFFLSFAFQFAAVTFFWPFYIRMLKTNYMQPLRFVEYSMSASLMTLIYATLLGIIETTELWLLFVSTGVTMLLGIVQEYMPLFKKNYKKLNYFEYFLPHMIGWFLFIPTMLIFVAKFSLSVSNGPSKPPEWVYGVYSSQFVLLSAFGFNQALQQRALWLNLSKPMECERLAIVFERRYMMMSLTTKSILAWILYANFLAESRISRD